jgi:hypothetical protein
VDYVSRGWRSSTRQAQYGYPFIDNRRLGWAATTLLGLWLTRNQGWVVQDSGRSHAPDDVSDGTEGNPVCGAPASEAELPREETLAQ